MSESKPRKLALSRETLRPLSDEELGGINGGTSILPITRWATRNVCPVVTFEVATRVFGCNGAEQAPQQPAPKQHVGK